MARAGAVHRLRSGGERGAVVTVRESYTQTAALVATVAFPAWIYRVGRRTGRRVRRSAGRKAFVGWRQNHLSVLQMASQNLARLQKLHSTRRAQLITSSRRGETYEPHCSSTQSRCQDARV